MPWLAAISAGIAASQFASLNIVSASWADNLLDKIIAAMSIFTAYLLTAITVLPAIEDKVVVRKLKQWGYFSIFVTYLRQAVWSGGVLILFSLALVPLRSAKMIPLEQLLVSSAWWALLVFSVVSIYRVSKLLFKFILAE